MYGQKVSFSKELFSEKSQCLEKAIKIRQLFLNNRMSLLQKILETGIYCYLPQDMTYPHICHKPMTLILMVTGLQDTALSLSVILGWHLNHLCHLLLYKTQMNLVSCPDFWSVTLIFGQSAADMVAEILKFSLIYNIQNFKDINPF